MTKIIGIPAFHDNYIWVLFNPKGQAVVVDPGEADQIIEYLKKYHLTLVAILITHHHFDHSGGIAKLLRHQKVPVYGGHQEPIDLMTHPVREGDLIPLEGLNLTLNVLEIPGHTLGHVAYVGNNLLFSGDTLFTAGCGRLFEGSAAQMLSSLTTLKSLDPQTQVYCGHEYTLANLHFATEVEPDNEKITSRLEAVLALRHQGLQTVPSALAEELATNPFLRCEHPDVIRAAEKHAKRPLHDAVEVFASLRQWKDHFKV